MVMPLQALVNARGHEALRKRVDQGTCKNPEDCILDAIEHGDPRFESSTPAEIRAALVADGHGVGRAIQVKRGWGPGAE